MDIVAGSKNDEFYAYGPSVINWVSLRKQIAKALSAAFEKGRKAR